MKSDVLKKILLDMNYSFPSKDIENYLIQCTDFIISKDLIDRYSTTIEVGSEKVTAEMISLYNIFKFDQRKFIDFILPITQSMTSLTIPNKVLGAILSILFFCWSMLKVTSKQFSEQDAKVLLSLYTIGGHGYVEDIADNYIKLFETRLSNKKIILSLELLADYNVIKQRENGEIFIIENIKVVRV
jgi:hypothetical protein